MMFLFSIFLSWTIYFISSVSTHDVCFKYLSDTEKLPNSENLYAICSDILNPPKPFNNSNGLTYKLEDIYLSVFLSIVCTILIYTFIILIIFYRNLIFKRRSSIKLLSLLSGRDYFKPFTYERLFERWEIHEMSHWMHREVPMTTDIVDWETKLSPIQKEFLTNIFRFFTQGDVDIAGAYYKNYLPLLGNLPEATMMMGSFAAREAIHIAAYSYLIETLGMPQTIYSDFLKYTEMKNKQDYLNQFLKTSHLIDKENITLDDKEHIALSIGLFSGGVEGIQLFSSFTMLLLFPLNNLLKGMGQIVTWSMVDESQHVDGMIDIFKIFVSENNLELEILQPKMHRIINDVVNLERKFIELIFDKYDSSEFFGMTSKKLELYIEYIADHRLKSMGFDKLFDTVDSNPIPEMSVMINAPSHTNFFENTSTDYSLVAYSGSWAKDVWGNLKSLLKRYLNGNETEVELED